MPSPLRVSVFLLIGSLMVGALPAAEIKGDLEKMQGRWKCTLCRENRALRKDYEVAVTIHGNKLHFETNDGGDDVRLALDSAHSPKQLQWTRDVEFFDRPTTAEFKGIYLLDDDTLVICVGKYGASGKQSSQDPLERPVAFESSESNGQGLFILKRDRSAPPNGKKLSESELAMIWSLSLCLTPWAG